MKTDQVKNLIKEAQLSGLVDPKTANAQIKMAEIDLRVSYSSIVKHLMRLGCYELYRKQARVMNEISKINLSLARFISATGVRLSAGRLVEFRRSEPIVSWQIKRLIDFAIQDKLITEEERSLFNDLIEWDDINFAFVEAEILNRIKDFSYGDLKSKAIETTEYIKEYYPDWWSKVISPEAKKLQNNNL